MALPTRLLTLDLRAGIEYPEALYVVTTRGDFYPAGPLDEGDEELHRFDLDLVPMGPEGPRCRRPLPPPEASYRRRGRESGAVEARAKEGRAEEERTEMRANASTGSRLVAGLWLFTQWRPADGGELALGIEWFAREAWWEGRELEGKLFLRLVREDGKLAFQILGRLARP
ncbi:MAG TPA: hypothetical protein VMV83_04745 [Rectinemataceae bacterium]|nr:hypothetical protein [Rectinemataceae bacterium]